MKTNHKLVSIIIPTFNRAHLIGETLDSILAQTYQKWECIIVDDGSSDNTDEVIGTYVEKDKRFKYYHRPEEHLPGGNGARNYGFKMSSGEYIQWFDSDDLMLAEKLELKVRTIINENLDFVICSMNFYQDGKLINGQSIQVKTNLFKDYVLWNLKIYTPSILFKKESLKHSFNEQLLRGQETEYLSKFFYENLKANYKILETPLFNYRQHSNSKTQINKTYKPLFKKSQALVTLNNFERSFKISDKYLMNHLYKDLIKKYFLAIKHNDSKLKRLIASQLLHNKYFSNYSNFRSKLTIKVTNAFNLDSYKLRSQLLKRAK